MSDPMHPVPGDLHIDVSDLTVYDLTPDQIAKKTKVRDGFDKAAECLGRLKPEQIKQAGISTDEVDRCAVFLAQYKRADEVLPAAEKLVELLRETRIESGHQIGVILGDAAAQVRRRADRDAKAAEVLGALDELLSYVSAPAYKAVATRNKAGSEEGATPDNAAAPAAPPS